MRNALAALVAAATTVASTSAFADEHVVSQKGKAFSTKTIAVKPGDKVVFRNDDPFVHNIFSLSEPQAFDLGTYGQGQAKDVRFAKEGKYEVECAIHPEMKMVVSVAK